MDGGGGGEISGPGGWVPRRDVRSRAFKKPRRAPRSGRDPRDRAHAPKRRRPRTSGSARRYPRGVTDAISRPRARTNARWSSAGPPRRTRISSGRGVQQVRRSGCGRIVATTRVSRTACADAAGVIADTRGCSDRKHPPPRSRKNNRRRRFPVRWWFRFFRFEGAARGPFPTAPRASRRRTEGNPFRDAARRLRHVRRGQRHDRRSA